jgi:peptide/nickel transport system substrate-binding protein
MNVAGSGTGHRSRRGVAAIGVVAALLMTAAACSSNGSSDTKSDSGWTLTPTTPAGSGAVDSIVWNLGAGEPASLDPRVTWDTASGNIVLANVCDNLMRQAPGGGYEPGIAESVASPNATTYVYNIRQGVTFTDGSPLTADDVVYSLDRQAKSYWSVFYQNVKEIKQTGPLQVTVTLTKPDVVFPQVMSTPAGAIVEQKYTEAQGKAVGAPTGGLMCTGPYSLEKWMPGDSITLKANPDYWDSALKPKVGSIKFTFVRNASTVTNGLTTGAIDGTWNPPLSGLAQLKSSSDGTLYANTGALGTALMMSSFDGALKDVRIRQALQMSIDYQGIIAAIMKGAAIPAPALPTSVTWGYAKATFQQANDALPPAVQNLDGARKLVTEAGAPTEPIVIAYDSSDDTMASVLASVQDSAKQVGLDVQLKPMPTSTYLTLYYDKKVREGVDMFAVTSTFEVPDPLELYFQMLSPGPYNYTGYNNPEFNDPIREALGVSDPQKRAELVTQGQASATEQVQLWLTVYNPYQLLYLGDKITGAPVWTFGSLYYPWAATLGAP